LCVPDDPLYSEFGKPDGFDRDRLIDLGNRLLDLAEMKPSTQVLRDLSALGSDSWFSHALCRSF
jgi:hypothetical protein